MSTEILKKRLDFLPETWLGEVSNFLDFMYFKHGIAEKMKDFDRDFTAEEIAELNDRLDELDQNPTKPMTLAEYKKRNLELLEHELQNLEQYAS